MTRESSFFGFDVSTSEGEDSDDVSPVMPTFGGSGVVLQAARHRLSTPRGFMAAMDNSRQAADYGFDLRQFVGAKMGLAQRNALIRGAEQELTKDERILSARVGVTGPTGDNTLTVKCAIETSFGEFDLVLSVDELTVTDIT